MKSDLPKFAVEFSVQWNQEPRIEWEPKNQNHQIGYGQTEKVAVDRCAHYFIQGYYDADQDVTN